MNQVRMSFLKGSRGVLVGCNVALCLACLPGRLAAQWTTGSGGTIYYNGGNIGIGIATPAQKLDVESGTTSDALIRVGSNNSNVELGAGNGTYGYLNGRSWDLAIQTGGVNRLYIPVATGYVGIGTSTPTAALSVVNPGSTGGLSVNTWAAFQGNLCGIATLGANLYLNPNTDCTTWKWENTHPSLGGSAIQFNAYADVNAILFVRGSGATTANATATVTESMRITSSGNVGIGTTSPQHLLQVAGTIGAEQVIVSATGADYVFDPAYHLAPLREVAAYVDANHHLPGIPAAEEMKREGVSLGDMQTKLLAKVEELTLHMIELEKQNLELKERLAHLEDGTASKQR
jgi:hypothetical protein